LKNIAVIGVGNIGSRHLQALAHLKNFNLFSVDPSIEALDLASNMYTEVKTVGSPELYSLCDINKLPQNLFTVIMATNSRHRYPATKVLLEKKIKFIIFEKILFQQLDEYNDIEEQLIDNGISSYVNCWPRTIKYFIKLKEKINFKNILSFKVYGSNWGLACNMIHMLDYISFITDKSDYVFNNVNIEKISESKRSSSNILRKGFYDFTGVVSGMFDHIPFTFISYRRGNIQTFIEITTTDSIIIINPVSKYAVEISSVTNWLPKKKRIDIPFQSKRTGEIVKQLENTGTCNLTTFFDSCKLHKTMLEFLLESFQGTKLVDGSRCLIT